MLKLLSPLSDVAYKQALKDPKGPLPERCPLPEPAYFEPAAKAPSLCFETPAGMTQWYPAPMRGAAGLSHTMIADTRYPQMELDLLKRLTPDAYSEYMQRYLIDGLARFGDSWAYADLVTAVLMLAEAVKPRNYLEIGARRGRSVCAVASLMPACDMTIFDMWLDNYAGMDNPGPDFVRGELCKVGHRGKIEFIDGNSHETLPAYFKANPDKCFDMVTVDGDHTNLGAAQDLADVMPHVAIGGALIFDDVCHPKLRGLADVWRRVVAADPRFSTWTYTDVGYGVGFAIRKM